MATWEKIERTVNSEGTTITYRLKGTNMIVQSRLRHIPHAGGRAGTWDSTSYYVLNNGVEVDPQFWRLQDAKECAERLMAYDTGRA